MSVGGFRRRKLAHKLFHYCQCVRLFRVVYSFILHYRYKSSDNKVKQEIGSLLKGTDSVAFVLGLYWELGDKGIAFHEMV